MLTENLRDDSCEVASALRTSLGRIYTFGNGGSASIAEHMACDWMKGTNGMFQVVSLSSNGPLLSAIANDCGYDQTCAKQLEWQANPEDIVVLISSSGKSENIVKAAEMALFLGCELIGFTGFSGGPLKELADISVHISSDDYGIVEDYHSTVMHQVLRDLRGGK